MGPQGSGPEVPTDAVVLVVEEDEALAKQYADWLSLRWTVETAPGGGRALTAFEAEPDVVILRRQLSAIHGDRLLGIIHERGLRCRVAMITSVDPGPAAVRLGFDDYLVDPVTEDALVTTVEELLLRGVYEKRLAEFYKLAREKAGLESEHSADELTDLTEYQTLKSQLIEVRASVDEVLAVFREHDSYSKLCDELSRRPPENDVNGSVPEL